jgi:hypothetical protein
LAAALGESAMPHLIFVVVLVLRLVNNFGHKG